MPADPGGNPARRRRPDAEVRAAISPRPALEAFATDVAAHLEAVEVNPVAGGVDVGDGLLERRTGVGHAKDAPAGCFDARLARMGSGFALARAGVEDGSAGGGGVFETGDRVARANRSGVAMGGEDDADGWFQAEFQQARVLAAGSRGVHESAEVAIEAMQQRLRFGVAESLVNIKPA